MNIIPAMALNLCHINQKSIILLGTVKLRARRMRSALSLSQSR